MQENISNHNKSALHLTESQKRYLPFKRAMDILMSGAAIVVLSPVLGATALLIKMDSPGPVLFKQKRVGKNKGLFEIWKFRTMRTDTPKDMPTHMLSNPDAYITRTGKFLRKCSGDELPQLFNILKGEMTIIGPRPALWNQYDLIEERDKYGANDVTPGLTGWAQINGRDELEIDVKAELDGNYVKNLGIKRDLMCFFGTIGSVLARDGVVEGGTGEMKEEETKKTALVDDDKLRKNIITGAAVTAIGGTVALGALAFVGSKIAKKGTNTEKKCKIGSFFKIAGAAAAIGTAATVYTNIKRRVQLQDNFVNDDTEPIRTPAEDVQPKKILITGANSYIGVSVENWLNASEGNYIVDTLDMLYENWRECDFSQYDVVYHVAGIAHADVGNVSKEQQALYYSVNRDLTIEVAEKAKTAGVKQFIFMSSMIIYSGCRVKMITADTEPKAQNFYGDSKLQADLAVQAMADDSFKVVVLRPPMIYGKGSKGNYPELAKLATKLPVFPIVNNKRSMLHIDNLCEFVKLMIDNEESGVFFPQNGEYTNTSDMVQMIADVKGHRIIMLPFTNIPVKLMGKIPGKIGGLASKAFGDSAYDMSMSEYKVNYRVTDLAKSIQLTEGDF